MAAGKYTNDARMTTMCKDITSDLDIVINLGRFNKSAARKELNDLVQMRKDNDLWDYNFDTGAESLQADYARMCMKFTAADALINR